MTAMVYRIYVEKKQGFAIEAQQLKDNLKNYLGIGGLEEVRIVNRYDVAGLSADEYQQARTTIFAEPTLDHIYDEELPLPADCRVFAIEYLPGQYDQRADSAAQCIQILTQKERPTVQSAKVIILTGSISDEEFKLIKDYCINPVESREAELAKPLSLVSDSVIPAQVAVIDNFINWTKEELCTFKDTLGLAMSYEDIAFCQAYFRDQEHRNPTITEIKVIDTYWSDHCRHTTFMTKIEQVDFAADKMTAPIKAAYEQYLAARQYVYGERNKAITLMDIATMGMKELKKRGQLNDLDESDEINACSIVVPVDVDGKTEEWLVMFKNETHNHPTEIEPFGGAATCLGGAIRDPLSGRAYVYQAMRVSGSGDPRRPLAETWPGKLPQRKITVGAAEGYSSYGNQIGLATGQVAEVYHDGFMAKRMEVGAVIAAVPRNQVVRQAPQPGDVVILVGGRTGRDGCGGATGSSKEHDELSLTECGAEVQKGNAPTERKIQRLFRKKEVTVMIKKCNDFGAGGVSVAIGELTDGVDINLDSIPKKYEGLDGTELAISESQERMAVVVDSRDAEAFIAYAALENLEATIVATVTDSRRLRMFWRGQTIVDMSREFLNTNGVQQHTQVAVAGPDADSPSYFTALPPLVKAKLTDINAAWLANLTDLNVCSQKGLVERFDSTIGSNTVLVPFGGKYQQTPTEGMVAKLPVLSGETTTATIMTYGYNPQLATWSPFHGAVYAVVEAVTKVVALGGNYSTVRLTLQEYFEKLGSDAAKWGKPFSALLGAYHAQRQLGIAAIGGKDSMSGTFKDMHVPPTLIAFAVNIIKADKVISPEFKQAGSTIVALAAPRDEQELPDFTVLKANFAAVTKLMHQGKVLAASAVKTGGVAAAISKMAFGNKIGVVINEDMEPAALFTPDYGTLVLEIPPEVELQEAFKGLPYKVVGHTAEQPDIVIGRQQLPLEQALTAWQQPLESIFPTRTHTAPDTPPIIAAKRIAAKRTAPALAKPRILIPVFPGTNCEYDSARAFEKAGGIVDTMIIRNLTPSDVEHSIAELAKRINAAQIVMLPGGFSAGDEPDGSGKFIATMFRNAKVKEAVMQLLKVRDGLVLGICNGFQALIKLGLLPYGEILDANENWPTLTYNTIGRHVSCMVRTKVVSTLSPWFNNVKLGDIHTIAVSHGEGRFVASKAVVEQLIANGQIATQYVDFDGNPSSDIAFNPNGSVAAIEAITSPCGRVLGKMGHSERIGRHVAVNIPGAKDQAIFAAGVNYFK